MQIILRARPSPPCYHSRMHYLILLAAVLLAVDGIRSIVEGVRTLANKSPDIEHDSESEKKLLSPYTRYWISRWYNGSVFLRAGIGFLLLAALIIYISK